jgi:hypothetical protein
VVVQEEGLRFTVRGLTNNMIAVSFPSRQSGHPCQTSVPTHSMQHPVKAVCHRAEVMVLTILTILCRL